MKYSNMVAGMYVIRTRDLPGAKKLSGVICKLEAVEPGSHILVHMTEDCMPVGNLLKIPVQGDDNCWYDVSELVLEANAVVLPPFDTDKFQTPTEANYRNFIGMGNQPALSLDEAIGQICLIGESNEKYGTLFGKQGYMVVGCDCNGYAIVYRGFCESNVGENKQKPVLQILNFGGTNRAFYRAREIVNACHKAYMEDCQLASRYRNEIEMDTSSASTEFGGSEMTVEELRQMSLRG